METNKRLFYKVPAYYILNIISVSQLGPPALRDFQSWARGMPFKIRATCLPFGRQIISIGLKAEHVKHELKSSAVAQLAPAIRTNVLIPGSQKGTILEITGVGLYTHYAAPLEVFFIMYFSRKTVLVGQSKCQLI